jgi:spore coat protein U-like protein
MSGFKLKRNVILIVMYWVLSLISMLGLQLVSTSAHAAKSSGSCWLSGTTLSFGSVTGKGKSNYANLQITCNQYNQTQTVNVALCPYITAGGLGLLNNRRLMVKYGAVHSYLSYDLFYDAALTRRIDTQANASTLNCTYQTFSVNEDEKVFTIPIYGLVYSGQNVPEGSFDNNNNTQVYLLYAFSEDERPSKEDAITATQSKPGTNSLNVTANFENSCNLISASDLNFGQINDFSKAVTSSTRVTLSCPSNTNWKVGLDQGLNYDGTTRRMRNGADYIGYELYQDAGYRQPWNTTDASQGTGTNGTQIIQIYGKVPQSAVVVPPGEYQDTITITLTY